MAKRIFQKDNLKWVYINQPTQEDLDYLKNAFDFHPLISESIVNPTLHPAFEEYKDHLFLILHFPVIFREKVANLALEVDFIFTKNTVVTITYQPYKRLEEFFDKIADDTETQKRFQNHQSGKLVYGIIDSLLSNLINDVDFLELEITRIEDEIFEMPSHQIVEDISHARRDILDFRRIITATQPVLEILPQAAVKFYGDDMDPYFTDLVTTEHRIRHLVENHKETIEALNATHESLLSSRTSSVIGVLTVFSAILLPLNLIASLWGTNYEYLPLSHHPYGFWILAGAMVFIAIGLVAIFRYKRWL